MKDPPVNSNSAALNSTSLTLLEKVRQNDRAAWGRLVNLYTPLVYYWCKRAGLQRSNAEEVGQEVFLAVVRSLSTYSHDCEGASFRGWLRRITHREILDHAAPPGGRGTGRTSIQELLGQVEAGSEEPELVSLEKNILYHRAISLIESGFELTTSRAFWLLLGGREPKEVATELGISLSAVYTAKSKILRRLREEFRDVLGLPKPTLDSNSE